ncbi:hypothetical protein BGX38DRAFT_1194250 [Terfezia claveryi]|nr:hypothetical protein BGX38DRAFT_1194250 [Terfezia claveryi]
MAMDAPDISTPTAMLNPDADTIPTHYPLTKQISQLDLHPQATSSSSSSSPPPPYQLQHTHKEEDPYAIPSSSQNYKSFSSTSSPQPLYPYFHCSTIPDKPQSQLPASCTPIAPPTPPISSRETRRGGFAGKRTRSQMERENSGGAGAGVGIGVRGMEMGIGSSQGAIRID